MPNPEVSINPVRALAAEHIRCNVSLDIYSDGCICLQCDDCNVIIENYGKCRLSQLTGVLNSIAEIKVNSNQPANECETPLEIIEDFNAKFYEQTEYEQDEDGSCEAETETNKEERQDGEPETIRENVPVFGEPEHDPELDRKFETVFGVKIKHREEERHDKTAAMRQWIEGKRYPKPDTTTTPAPATHCNDMPGNKTTCGFQKPDGDHEPYGCVGDINAADPDGNAHADQTANPGAGGGSGPIR
jgi:hypothetical protein